MTALPFILEFGWQDQAACATVPRDVFFPRYLTRANLEAARAVCAACPVAEECFWHAVEYQETGIWAGTTERQRKRILRVMGAAA